MVRCSVQFLNHASEKPRCPMVQHAGRTSHQPGRDDALHVRWKMGVASTQRVRDVTVTTCSGSVRLSGGRVTFSDATFYLLRFG